MMVDNIPCHFTFVGDNNTVASWLPFAKQMFRDIRRLGIPVKMIKPADGVEIQVMSVGAQLGRIHIKVSTEDAIHGLAYFENPGFPIKYNKKNEHFEFRLLYPRKVKSNDSQSFGPWSGEAKLIGNFGETQNSLKISRRDLIPFAWIAGIENPDARGSVIYATPGKYSGEMRKVVQCMIAQGWPVPFDYRYTLTHGIMRCRDGSRWIIEISNTNGIRCKPIEFVRKPGDEPTTPKAELRDALGYTPITKNPLTVGEWTVLLPPSGGALPEYFLSTPYAENIGWAFSITGSEAQNTCWIHPDQWRRGRRFKVIINQNPKGTKPISATVSMVEEGILKGDRVTHFKIWDDKLKSLISFDLLYDNPPDPPPLDTPWYVYYNGDSEVVARYTNPFDPGSSFSISDLPGSGVNYDGGSILLKDIRKYQGITGTSFVLPKIYIAGIADSPAIGSEYGGSIIDIRLSTVGGPVQNTVTTTLFSVRGLLDWTEYLGAGGSISSRSVGIVPGGDRECLYLYNETADAITSADTYRHAQKGCAIGPYIRVTPFWNSGVDIFSLGPGTPSLTDTAVLQGGTPTSPSGLYDGSSCTYTEVIGGAVLPAPGSLGAPLEHGALTAQPFVQYIQDTQTLSFYGADTMEVPLLNETTSAYPSGIYREFVDGIILQQTMYSVPDAFGKYQFISRIMDGISGVDLYPIAPMPYSYNESSVNTAFFVGRP